jgi:hypothetical protein
MYDLIAIVKATRASAKALADSHNISRRMREKGITLAEHHALAVKLVAANARYHKAQAVLAANPLPGDTN